MVYFSYYYREGDWRKQIGVMSNMKDCSIVDDNRVVDFKELKKLVLYSRAQIWRLEKRGLFPRRFRLSPYRVAWSLKEVLEWRDSRRPDPDAHA